MSNTDVLWVRDPEVQQWCTYVESDESVVYEDGTREWCSLAEWNRWCIGREIYPQRVQSASVPRAPPDFAQPGPVDPWQNGMQLASAQSPQYVVAGSQIIPPQDPAACQCQITASSNVAGQVQIGPSTPNVYTPLDPHYEVKKQKFWARYRVFKKLVHESAGDDNGTSQSAITRDTFFGENIHSKIQWFVVVHSFKGHSLCLPIMTYQRKGIAKPGVEPSHHAIVYSGRQPDEPSSEEKKRGPMLDSIRVSMDDPESMLDPLSRINYAKITTIEHNAKVKAFGWIHPHSRDQFDIDEAYFRSASKKPSLK